MHACRLEGVNSLASKYSEPMRFAVCVALAALAAGAAAPPQPVSQLIAVVRGEIAQKRSDAQAAKALSKIRLAESLDEHVIEELESEGAGPKTVEELERLREVSKSLDAPAVPPVWASPDPPAAADRTRIIEEARAIALNYTDSLPDFVAVQVVRRYLGDEAGWRLKDTITLKLTYFEKAEKYDVLLINNRKASVDYDQVGGAVTQGEFASLLRDVFEPATDAQFAWDHWTHLRGRTTHVFTFRVRRERSHLKMRAGRGGGESGITAGHHGFVYVDGETGQIVRLISEADSIPAGFPVREYETTLDYGFAEIAGRRYLLPLRAEDRVAAEGQQMRNSVRFEQYRKFGSDTSIKYEGTSEDKPIKH